MYRADTFMPLRDALHETGGDLDAFVDRELQQSPLQRSDWTKHSLFALFSQDIDLSPICFEGPSVCLFCARQRAHMVQPFWMRVLRVIQKKAITQNIEDVTWNMIRVRPQPNTDSKMDHREVNVDQRTQVHGQQYGETSAHFESSYTHMEEPRLVQSTDGITDTSSIYDDSILDDSMYDDISIEDEDMCIFCWHVWKNTGHKPLPDGSDCLHCHRVIRETTRGRGETMPSLCVKCEVEQESADFQLARKEMRCGRAKVDSGDADSVVNSPSNIQSIPSDGHPSSPSKIFITSSPSIQEFFFNNSSSPSKIFITSSPPIQRY